jgi:hypothetical protein
MSGPSRPRAVVAHSTYFKTVVRPGNCIGLIRGNLLRSRLESGSSACLISMSTPVQIRASATIF